MASHLGVKDLLYNIGSRLFDYGFNYITTPRPRAEDRISQIDRLIQALPADDEPIVEPPALYPDRPAEAPAAAHTAAAEDIASGCLPCAVGHFSTSSGLLKEALRFKDRGMESNEILDRIAGVLEEQNALEREDLTPEKIRRLAEWERPIAEEALARSRQLRHRLEGIRTIEELEGLAADTRTYYLTLSRQWYKGRFGMLGADKAEAIAQRTGGR